MLVFQKSNSSWAECIKNEKNPFQPFVYIKFDNQKMPPSRKLDEHDHVYFCCCIDDNTNANDIMFSGEE